MFLYLLERLLAAWPGPGDLHGLDKIALRACLAALASFVLAIVCGPRWIAWLNGRFREPIKCTSAEVSRLHLPKQATPTMGGLFIVGGLVASTLAFADWTNPFVGIAMLLAVSLAATGSLRRSGKTEAAARGISPRAKLLAQSAIALVAAVLVYRSHAQSPALALVLPLVGTSFNWACCSSPWRWSSSSATSNAVNLADGLDGLAGGCLICATPAVALVAYACGHAGWAEYLGIPHLAGAGEMLVIAAGMSAACSDFCGSIAIRPRSSWATPARCHWAACSDFWPSSRDRSCCSWRSAACLSLKPRA